ncbi:unnamed protein product [Leuciscus chuanchicus]
MDVGCLRLCFVELRCTCFGQRSGEVVLTLWLNHGPELEKESPRADGPIRVNLGWGLPLSPLELTGPPEHLGERDKMPIMSVLYLGGQTQSRAGSALSPPLFEIVSECIICARAGCGPSKTATF